MKPHDRQENDKDAFIVVGKVIQPYGVMGWLKVYPFTQKKEALLAYTAWWLGKSPDVLEKYEVMEAKLHGKQLVAQLKGVEDRGEASVLKGFWIAIPKIELPTLKKDEYYWTDLINLQVENESGTYLGKVESLLETLAHDVLVVKNNEREHLIPFVLNKVISKVDLEEEKIIVDWRPEWV